MVTVQPKKILHSLRFFVLRTIASLIFIPTILLLCTVSIIKPLALHNAGDRRNAVPCAALGCMKFTLVFLTLFFQRCKLHSDPTSFPACSAAPRFQLRFRPCDLWRSPASGWRPAARQCARCVSHVIHHAADIDQSAGDAHRPLLVLPLLNEFPLACIMYMTV